MKKVGVFYQNSVVGVKYHTQVKRMHADEFSGGADACVPVGLRAEHAAWTGVLLPSCKFSTALYNPGIKKSIFIPPKVMLSE